MLRGQFSVLSVFLIIFAVSVSNASPFAADDAANWCDDDALKNISHQVELLKVMDENISLKLDILQLRLEQQFASQRNSLFQDIRELLSAKEGLLIDVRTDASPISKQVAVDNTLKPSNCAEALKSGDKSGIYQIFVKDAQPFYVYCLVDPHNGPAWTVLQRRQDGSTDFYRDWIEYKRGFGNLHNEFFIGLDKMHVLTNDKLQELWIELLDFDGTTRFAKYDNFNIGSEYTKYDLNVLGAYSGDAGDSLRIHQGRKFTTKDMDNDTWEKNCAQEFTGAWWYANCHDSNLNGQYLKGAYPKEKYAKGIDWKSWHGHNYSMKYVHMAIRPVQKK